MLMLLLAIGVIEVTTYICNPLHTAASDPFARLWGLKAFHQPTQSMELTIRAGAISVVFAWPYLRDQPKSGDVIAFRYPLDPRTAYVKRVIAAGDATVSIVEGVTIFDGKPLREPYVHINASSSYCYTKMSSVRVPRNCHFVMNGNRDVGSDSRQWGMRTTRQHHWKVTTMIQERCVATKWPT
jgi:signal peptidase I